MKAMLFTVGRLDLNSVSRSTRQSIFLPTHYLKLSTKLIIKKIIA